MNVHEFAAVIRRVEIVGLSSDVARAIAEDIRSRCETPEAAMSRLLGIESALSELVADMQEEYGIEPA